MQFEVQGQNYFLRFHPGEGRWYLLKPTDHGVSGMAVLDDGGLPAALNFPVLHEDEEEEGEGPETLVN